jgi:hypothetical protein
MRLGKQVITDHDLIISEPDDHHLPATYFTIAINAQAIAGNTAYEHRINLGNSGHKTMRVIIQGDQTVLLQGYEGAFILANDTSQECSAMSVMKYSPTYITSYMGTYSRLHGDSYLSDNVFGDGHIRLRDAYIDGDEAVLEFFNSDSSSRDLTVYGTGVVK